MLATLALSLACFEKKPPVVVELPPADPVEEAEGERETSACVGAITAPPGFAPIDDPDLVAASLGEPTEGGLCQAQAFRATEALPIHRAWNSTNPNSELGDWWALEGPSGSVAAYREDYEICYQWSPLDSLVSCTLKAGSAVAIGTGQSATCSDYLSYPASAALQLYLPDAESSTVDCVRSELDFAWTPVE